MIDSQILQSYESKLFCGWCALTRAAAVGGVGGWLVLGDYSAVRQSGNSGGAAATVVT